MTGHVRTVKVKKGWDRLVRSVKGSELSHFHYFTALNAPKRANMKIVKIKNPRDFALKMIVLSF